MNKTSYLCLLAMFMAPPTWSEEEMYLEGISVLGNHKSAYLAVKDGKVTVREGDMVGPLRVTRIEQNSIFLVTNKGESTQLLLHSRLPLASQDLNSTDELTEEQLRPDSGEGSPEEDLPEERSLNSESSTSQAPEEPPAQEKVPKGYRKVRTPFGEIIVPEENSPETSNTLSSQPSEHPSISEVSPGYHKIKTPFGEFMVEDQASLQEKK